MNKPAGATTEETILMVNAIARAVNPILERGNYSSDDMVHIFCSFFVAQALDPFIARPKFGLGYILETVQQHINEYAVATGLSLRVNFISESDTIRVDDGVKH